MLRHIVIDNFKSLKHLEYECVGLNILAGMNGAGKSSFIQFLRLLKELRHELRGNRDTTRLRSIGIGGTFSDLRFRRARPSDDVAYSVSFDYTTKRRGSCGVEFKRVVRTRPWDLKSVYSVCPEELVPVAGGEDFWEIRKAARKAVREREKKWIPHYIDLCKGIRFVDSCRIRPRDVFEGRAYDTEGLAKIVHGTFDPEGEDIASFLYEQGNQVMLSSDSPMRFPGVKNLSLIAQLNGWMSIISPGATVCVRRVELGSEESFVLNIGFGEDKNARRFPPQNVGFGITYGLPVLVTLLSSNPGDIVIIENPEAHLHPRGQAEMGKLLARAAANGTQIFVETHSDHIINGARVAVKRHIIRPELVKIAFFNRAGHDCPTGVECCGPYTEVCEISMDECGCLSNYPDGFLDEWSTQTLRLLKS